MEKWGWVSSLVEPTFLASLCVAVILPRLLLPGTAGLLVAGGLVVGLLWFEHRVGESVRRLPPRVGAEAMVGLRAVVVEPLEPLGTVDCGGERWKAVEIGGRRVGQGQWVRVVQLRGLQLEVEVSRESLRRRQAG